MFRAPWVGARGSCCRLGAYTDSGNLVKMNPPLRCRKSMAAMMQHVLDGNINIIGTDHAPHTLARKNDPTSPASGIPALPYWPWFIEILQDLGCSRGLIDSMTYYTAARLFKFDTHRARDGRCNVNIDYDPSLWDAYGWNPFEWVDKTYLSRREKAKTSNRPFHNAEAENVLEKCCPIKRRLRLLLMLLVLLIGGGEWALWHGILSQIWLSVVRD